MTDTLQIDINADVGEGIGNESKLMPYLSSCNIACGGHAGDELTIMEVVKLAKKHNVKVGAHPSFPDKANFGRLEIDISAEDLYSSLKQQVSSLQRVLHNETVQLHHIKPHGALYNLASKDERIAKVVIELIKSLSFPIKLYAPFNSVITKLAIAENIEVVYEGFADRNYNEDLSLVSRKNRNAVLNDNEVILNHVLRIIRYQKVKAISGVEVPLKIETLCVHGDAKSAVDILKYLNLELPKNRIKIQ
ncbi:5-oxoprolinase subunit PxpA [Winogradskyella sp. PG-2]|uniref:5-oxoprolinase subunit PxpA n=1 Tax=Winogradskyella sp. PG-2 TaxID=754409 RepID=UPI0004588E3B|nr:5-oxoprolinase subunit PxpA [Winogradskyella sp. PG-2]BAO77642.1 lactam utilization protein LamB [Winogradskyella sp. PG-2]